jgi:hypothetical protein
MTDRGSPVPIYRVEKQVRGPGGNGGSSRPAEVTYNVIRTACADPNCNCHGWVFAAGKGWLTCERVEQILQDNGYAPVAVPRTGDLVVYRSAAGETLHTGLVRLASADGLVLIESKWGHWGRYLHRPQDQPYGSTYAYYRTSRRGGHRLRLPQPPLIAPHSPTPDTPAVLDKTAPPRYQDRPPLRVATRPRGRFPGEDPCSFSVSTTATTPASA